MINKLKDFFIRLNRRFTINRLTFKDYVINLYLKWKFQFIRTFLQHKLRNYSQEYKQGFTPIYIDYFEQPTWSNDGTKPWLPREHWGNIHPDRLNVYYSSPTWLDEKARFKVIYEPKEFNINGDLVDIPYKVSLISSAKSISQKYGRFECRMTLPKGKGVWPAFWLWGTAPSEGKYIEIDVYEAYGRYTGTDTIYQEPNIHYRDGNKDRHIKPWLIKIDKRSNLTNEYHEFAVNWSEDKIEFFTNGIKVFQFTDKKVLDAFFNLPDAEMWVVVNNSLKEGYTNSTSYYSKFNVDYIRIYKLNN